MKTHRGDLENVTSYLLSSFFSDIVVLDLESFRASGILGAGKKMTAKACGKKRGMCSSMCWNHGEVKIAGVGRE